MERDLQHKIMTTLGARKGLMLMRNNVGTARHAAPNGTIYHVKYGLGVGSADLIGCLSGCPCPYCGAPLPWGRFCALEVKTPTGKQTAEQHKWQRALEYNGGYYTIIRNLDDANRFYDNLTSGD